MKITIVKFKARTKKDLKKVIKKLEVKYISKKIKREDIILMKNNIKMNIEDGHFVDLFYFLKEDREEDISYINSNDKITKGVIDWDYNSKELKQLAKKLNCKQKNFNIIKI